MQFGAMLHLRMCVLLSISVSGERVCPCAFASGRGCVKTHLRFNSVRFRGSFCYCRAGNNQPETGHLRIVASCTVRVNWAGSASRLFLNSYFLDPQASSDAWAGRKLMSFQAKEVKSLIICLNVGLDVSEDS